jgi:hypothetical protein
VSAGSGTPQPAPDAKHRERGHGLRPRFVPQFRSASASFPNVGAATQLAWFVLNDSPSGGKLWNLRALTFAQVGNFTTNFGGQFVLLIGSKIRQNGQLTLVANELGSDAASQCVANGYTSSGFPWTFSRYQTWVRPGEWLMVGIAPTLAQTNWNALINFSYDQYEAGDILPGWDA